MMPDASRIPTPATPDVCTVVVLVDGVEIPGVFHVMSVTVARELNRIPTAFIELRDGEASKATFEASNTDYFVPGRKIDIQLGYRAKNASVFRGIVIKHGIRVRKNGSLLSVECRHEAVKLTADTRNHYYAGRKDSDIIEEIIQSHGLKAVVEATAADLEGVVQYQATDWDFMLCRAEANGLVVMVEDGAITVARPATGKEPVLAATFGTTLMELDAEIDARLQSKGVKAAAWSAVDQAPLEAEASEPPASSAGNLAALDLAGVIGGNAQVMRHGGSLGRSELQAWADGCLQRERLAKLRGRAKFQGFAGIRPGQIMQLGGVGKRFEGSVYVAGVRHMVADGNWETDVQFGLNPQRFAEAYNVRPLPAAGLLPSVCGLQMGVVTALQGDPAGEERIRVRLPLISNAEDGTWVRIATLDAGRDRGTFFRPEIGDEVVVGFVDNDPRHAVLLGMCHSSAKPAPQPAEDSNHRKGYVSRDKMRFLFDDDRKSVLLETPGGNRLTLSEQARGVLLEDQNGNRIRLDDSGVLIESSKDLVLKAAKDIRLEGVNVDIKAGMRFKAGGAATAELSSATTTVKGSAITVVEGGLVKIN
jgi:Rhs element Vgr protein